MSDLTEQSTVSLKLVITIIGGLFALFIAVTPGIIGTVTANETKIEVRANKAAADAALAAHLTKAEADKKELQTQLSSVREEQVRAQERTQAIVDGLRRVESQLQQSTVVVRAGGRSQ